MIETWWTYDVAPRGPNNVGWPARAILGALALLTAIAILIVLRRVFRALPDRAKETATWMIMGSLFALVPLLAVVPAMRLLGVAAMGVAIATALILDHVWFPAPSKKKNGES